MKQKREKRENREYNINKAVKHHKNSRIRQEKKKCS